MLTAFDARLLDLRRTIRDYAAKAPPEFVAQADTNAALELADIRERLLCCDTDAEADAVLVGWIHVWSMPA